jgi:hypothetical protein
VWYKVAQIKTEFNKLKMMIFKIKKRLAIGFCLLLSLYTTAQVAISKTAIDGNGILDFGLDNKAIILPWVSSLTTTSLTDGTLIFDSSDNKVKVLINTIWTDLSKNSGTLDARMTANITAQIAKIEGDGGVIIGPETSTALGVLVLESDDKALILPKMTSPHLNMIDPEPGTLVYDTSKNLMCVYNGSEWTFWGIGN